MRPLVAGAGVAIGARLVPQLIGYEHQVTGTHGSPRTAGRVGAPGAGPVTLGQSPARVWHRIAGGS